MCCMIPTLNRLRDNQIALRCTFEFISNKRDNLFDDSIIGKIPYAKGCDRYDYRPLRRWNKTTGSRHKTSTFENCRTRTGPELLQAPSRRPGTTKRITKTTPSSAASPAPAVLWNDHTRDVRPLFAATDCSKDIVHGCAPPARLTRSMPTTSEKTKPTVVQWNDAYFFRCLPWPADRPPRRSERAQDRRRRQDDLSSC